MSASHDKVAERVFETLKGYGLQLKLFDEQGNRTVDPTQARRFFAEPGSSLVSIKDDGEDSEINLYLSQNTNAEAISDLMDQLRRTAVHYNLQFTVRRYGKEITPKDFAFVGESRGIEMDKVEEARNPMTGSMKSSYQNWNSAKLIVRHTKPVAEEVVGSRSRNIQKIFVETIEGERFKFPVIHLGGARAMARHVGAGGTFYDKVGQHIIGLSEEFKDMQRVSAHIFRNRSALNEDAFNLRESVRSRIDEIRHELGRFMTISGYEQKVEEVEAIEAEPLNEESLQEEISALKTMLKIDESDASLDVALGRVAPMVAEKKPAEEADPAMVELVKNAYSTGRGGDGISMDTPRDAELINAAFLLSNPDKLEFMPGSEKAAAQKAEFGAKMSPMQHLAWRLGAIAERMKPTSDGAIILSTILARISAKIMQALDAGGPQAKVGVSAAEKQIIQMFLKNVAPVIGESMANAGYNDWNLNEEPVVEEEPIQEAPEEVDEESTEEGVEYREAREISEWFENFDPLTIIKESAKKEAEVEEGKEEEVAEEHEEVNESEVLNKEEAWWIADHMIRGVTSPTDVATCYEAEDRAVIAEVLRENWTTSTTEAIIKDLSVNEEEEVDEMSCSDKDKKKEK